MSGDARGRLSVAVLPTRVRPGRALDPHAQSFQGPSSSARQRPLVISQRSEGLIRPRRCAQAFGAARGAVRRGDSIGWRAGALTAKCAILVAQDCVARCRSSGARR